MSEHEIIAGLVALAGMLAGYYFRSMSQSIRALQCSLKECLAKIDPPTPED